MSDDTPVEKLLSKAFKGEEWEYLAQHPAFQLQTKNAPDTIQGYEQLVEIGSLLIRQRDELSLLLKRQQRARSIRQ